jgi:cellulose synthase operon protein C
LYEVQGRALKQQAKFPEARKALEQAIATPEAFRTETAAKAQLLIAETYFLEENWQQAFLAYQKVYASYAYPEWQAAALLQSGKCDEQLGQWKEAAATYGQLLTEFPESPYVEEAKRRQQQARQRAGR